MAKTGQLLWSIFLLLKKLLHCTTHTASGWARVRSGQLWAKSLLHSLDHTPVVIYLSRLLLTISMLPQPRASQKWVFQSPTVGPVLLSWYTECDPGKCMLGSVQLKTLEFELKLCLGKDSNNKLEPAHWEGRNYRAEPVPMLPKPWW